MNAKHCYVNANGIRQHYIDYAGEGPALILMPGLTANARFFDGLIGAGLAPALRVIAVLVLVFSLLSAIWAAFYSARRLVAPITDIAEGTGPTGPMKMKMITRYESNDKFTFTMFLLMPDDAEFKMMEI